MLNFMPLWLYITDMIIFTAVVLLIVFSVIIKYKIRKTIRSALDTPAHEKEKIELPVSQKILVLYSDYIEKLSRLYAINLPVLTGLDELWLRKLQIHPGKKYITRLLKYVPEKSLFDIMTAVFKKNSLEKYFLAWIQKSGEFMILKKIAISGNGRAFNGKKAALFFRNKKEALIEMMADPLWQCRYFAANILVQDPTGKADEILLEAFHDSNKKVRINMINTYQSGQKSIYELLIDLFLNDPVFEVRKSAKIRIDKDYKERYTLSPESFTIVQKLHLVELLNPMSDNDKNTGIAFLKSNNMELRRYASRYLMATGTLSRLFSQAEPGDVENFERTYSLLQNAVSANCTDFLADCIKIEKPGPLLIASRLLKEDGNRLLITSLLEKAVLLYNKEPDSPVIKEMYINTLICTCSRGNDTALVKLGHELIKQKYNRDIQIDILPLLPDRGETILIPVLLDFLKDSGYSTADELITTLSRFSISLIVPTLLKILRDGDTTYNYTIKKRSLQVLGEMAGNCGILYIMENLTLFSHEEAKKYMLITRNYFPEIFNERAEILLTSHDAELRSHLTAALPKESVKTFLPYIISFLEDSDPEVRIAALRALAEHRDQKIRANILKLLHDPVEKVRIETARLIGMYGKKKELTKITEMLSDQTEIMSVKKAIIMGLSESKTDASFEILTDKLSGECELPELLTEALTRYNSATKIKMIFEYLEKAPPDSQPGFKALLFGFGKKAEVPALDILSGGNRLLKEYALSVLEKSGYIDKKIRTLGSKKQEDRIKAAKFLAQAGTRKAYRGLITAARDPDESIRIEVIKAIDRLNTREGNELLVELKNDPDRKVRRYTLWALERLEAKELSKEE